MFSHLDKLSDNELLKVEKEIKQEKKRRQINKKNLTNELKIINIENNNKINDINIITNKETKLMEYCKFINLTKINQDIYLSCLILNQSKTKNNKIKTIWAIKRDLIKKYLKVGSSRLNIISKNIFIKKNITNRIHGNTNKISNNKLLECDINDIRSFILNLEFEWWPEELKGKEYCKVLSDEVTWNDLYLKYVNYKCKKENIKGDQVMIIDTF